MSAHLRWLSLVWLWCEIQQTERFLCRKSKAKASLVLTFWSIWPLIWICWISMELANRRVGGSLKGTLMAWHVRWSCRLYPSWQLHVYDPLRFSHTWSQKSPWNVKWVLKCGARVAFFLTSSLIWCFCRHFSVSRWKNEWMNRILPQSRLRTRRNLCRLQDCPRQALILQDSNIWDLSRWWHIYGSMTFSDRTAPACIGDPHRSYLGNQSDDCSTQTSGGTWRHPKSRISSWIKNNWSDDWNLPDKEIDCLNM